MWRLSLALLLSVVLLPQLLLGGETGHIDVLRCCEAGMAGRDEELMRCANESASLSLISHKEPQSGSHKVALVSYSTMNIFGYGAYSLAMNTAFAQYHQFRMLLFTPLDGSNYEPRDARWNKVKIMQRVLEEANENVDDSFEYAIWLDTDLVFLDYDISFEDIISRYSQYDMIFSADPITANGVVNSGCMIAKNTHWTRSFLDRWWSRFDRAQGMDQHAFTRLWEDEPNIDNHIKILPSHTINSHIPSWRYQKSDHQVLHLAGESNVLRRLVFQKGFQTLCKNSLSGASVLWESVPGQLGLDRQYLSDVRLNLPINETVAKIVEEMISKEGKYLPLTEIKQLFSGVQDVLQVGVNALSTDITQSLLWGIRWTYSAMKKSALHAVPGSRDELECVQGVLDAFFNYVVLFNQVDRTSYLEQGGNEFKNLKPWVEKLLTLVSPEDIGSALYFKFKYFEMVAMLHKQRKDIPQMLVAFESTSSVWWEMHKLKSYGSGNGVMNPFSEIQSVLLNIAAFSCGDDANVESLKKGLNASVQSLSFFEQTWGEKLRQSSLSVPSLEIADQAARLYYAGCCAVRLRDMRAKEWFESSLKTLKLQEVLQKREAAHHDITDNQEYLRLALASAVQDQLNVLKTLPEPTSYQEESSWRSKGADTASTKKKKVFRRRRRDL